MIKRKYRHTKVDSLAQIAEVVNSSTLERRNTAYVIGHDTTSPFTYYTWSEFLGVVFVREFANSKEEIKTILKPGHTIPKDTLPSTLSPTGLSPERERYLYEQIRPFCQLEYRDLTCPVPSGYQNVVVQHKRLCSHCRLPGHTKTKKGKVTCPELLQGL